MISTSSSAASNDRPFGKVISVTYEITAKRQQDHQQPGLVPLGRRGEPHERGHEGDRRSTVHGERDPWVLDPVRHECAQAYTPRGRYDLSEWGVE